MVLLVQPLGATGRHDQLVDALAGDRVGVGQEVGTDAAVARLPGRAAVLGGEGPDRRDGDPHLRRVAGVGDDRVQAEAAGAGLPGPARGVLGQAGHVPPGQAAVLAPEEAGRGDAGVERVAARRHVPDGLDGRSGLAVGQALARVVQVAPRSSLRQTAGPYHSLPPPA